MLQMSLPLSSVATVSSPPLRHPLSDNSKAHRRAFGSSSGSSVQEGRLTRVHRTVARAAPAVSAPGDQYFASDQRPIVLFDGVCNLCNGGVDTALRFDKNGRLRFAALQSHAGRELLRRSGRSPDDISSIVLVETSASYIKSEAILRIARNLQLPFPALASFGLPLPLPVRDTLYDAVANSRYSIFGSSTVCRMKEADAMDRFIE